MKAVPKKTKLFDEGPFDMENFIEGIGKLFQSRDIAHLAHLETDNGFHHCALGEYYEGITGYIDTLVEIYQGQMNTRLNLFIPASTNEDIVFHLENLLELTEEAQTESRSINAVIDQIHQLISTTLYKLKQLK